MMLYSPELEEQLLDTELEKVTDVITAHGGKVLNVHRWKKRKLAYAVKKFDEGLYVVCDFVAPKRVLSELDYILRYDEQCLRYLILDVLQHPGMQRRATEGEAQ